MSSSSLALYIDSKAGPGIMRRRRVCVVLAFSFALVMIVVSVGVALLNDKTIVWHGRTVVKGFVCGFVQGSLS